jgi:hypothetical protein
MKGHLRKYLRFAPVALAAALVIGNSDTVSAAGCFEQLRDCFVRAAGGASYWQAVGSSFECEYEFLDCIRREIIGR